MNAVLNTSWLLLGPQQRSEDFFNASFQSMVTSFQSFKSRLIYMCT